MAVVTFDLVAWKLRYPEFASIADPLAQLYFNEATIYCDNTDSSPVQDVTTRAVFLNMLTAHIAQLYNASTSQGQGQLTGRISGATEGSVNVSTEMPPLPGSAAWFSQTKYGMSYWQATAQYRQFLYIAACPPVRPAVPF